MRDNNRPCLYFQVQTLEHGGSLQVFWGKDAAQIIIDANAYDVKLLNGRVCVVSIKDYIMTFERMWNCDAL